MTTARTTFTPATEGHSTWRLPVDHPIADPGAAATGGAEAAQQRSTDMTIQNTQAQAQSPHLTEARRLLDDVAAATDGPGGEPQAQATAAAAHAILVLAEQVAAARLTMTRTALTQQQQPEASS